MASHEQNRVTKRVNSTFLERVIWEILLIIKLTEFPKLQIEFNETMVIARDRLGFPLNENKRNAVFQMVDQH